MKISVALALLLCTVALSAQEPNKPQISTVTATSHDAPLFAPNCTASRSGYLENNGKKMTEAEMTRFVTSSLRDGYVLTLYPESKNGVFVEMNCTAAKKVTSPERP